MTFRLIRFAFLACCLLLAGCHARLAPAPFVTGPHAEAADANQVFLNQKTFDPWVFSTTDPKHKIDLYLTDLQDGMIFGPQGSYYRAFAHGNYGKDHRLIAEANGSETRRVPVSKGYLQTLNMNTGALTTNYTANGVTDGSITGTDSAPHWKALWQHSDIVIANDPEAQQVTHANLFYLLSSTFPGSKASLPPMGLSSDAYGGHIFWDADVWMLPAFLPQHPDYAKPIVDYRFKLLAQARKNAKAHGFAGAEFPWESADKGKEEAPPGFAEERHITADVAFAAWQFYLWTGDKGYLKTRGWPLLQATAQYWTTRAKLGPEGQYHIKRVLGPDETAGLVDDDAYTNGVVKYNLLAATAAANILHVPADPRWAHMASLLFLPVDQTRLILAENDRLLTDRFSAKQADTLLLLHPLGFHSDTATEGRMLDFYARHTIPEGPAMTSSIECIIAARLGRGPQSLDLFHDSYRPFERGPWDAFSEKRTTNNVYFLTGMAGCVQSVLYGFAGLQAVSPWEHGEGQKLVSDGDIALYCHPHLPPGWGKLILKGVRFHGHTLSISISPDNAVTVTPSAKR